MAKKIRQDIEKTGFISELKTGSILHTHKWSVSHSRSYEDYDQKKSREIDIVATKNYRDKKSNFYSEFNMVIEVKKVTKNPWVVFTTSHFYQGWGWRILHSGWNYTSKKASIFYGGVLSLDNPVKTKKRVGKAFHEAFKKPNEKSNIFEALLSSCKAAYYLKNNTGVEPFKDDFDNKSSVELHFFIPIIVLDGLLFEAYLDNGEIYLDEADWIPIEYQYSSREYGANRSEVTFLPIIVQSTSLEAFIENVNKWVESSNSLFAKQLLEIRSKKTK